MNRIAPIHHAPEGYPTIDTDQALTVPLRLKPVGVEELRQGFETDPVFRHFFAVSQGLPKMANERWLCDLVETINRKMAVAPSDMTGCELMFRFREAYGLLHHMAQATVRRGQGGGLHVGFAHQESIPSGDKRYRGRVFDTFDTREHMSGRNPPVLDSLLKQGLPDVKVVPCARPENIVMARWLCHEHCEHPYGFDGQQDAHGFQALACFDVTYAIHLALHGRETRIDSTPTMPDGFRWAISAYFGDGAYEPYRYFAFKGQAFDLESLSKKILVKGFLNVATTWGNTETWDVQPRPVPRLSPKF